ncbi:MAG: hypothetical protein L0L63_11240 [Staphylococcus equorum]|nr:hypothetical protein [Staphylococcus equorum]
MKLSWILWSVATLFWLLVILGLSLYSWSNGLSDANNKEVYSFFWLLIGLLVIPLLYNSYGC